jgi:hypothetical protein
MLCRPGNRHGPPRLSDTWRYSAGVRVIQYLRRAMPCCSLATRRRGSFEAIYSSVDVIAQRRATLERLALNPGESVIDITEFPMKPLYALASHAERHLASDGRLTITCREAAAHFGRTKQRSRMRSQYALRFGSERAYIATGVSIDQ